MTHLACPSPFLTPADECELYYVERDTLFSYHKVRLYRQTYLQRTASPGASRRPASTRAHLPARALAAAAPARLPRRLPLHCETQSCACRLCAAHTHAILTHPCPPQASETFLQRMMALYVASHYKNTPNDLILMSDAPAHHLFVLLGPVDETQARAGAG